MARRFHYSWYKQVYDSATHKAKIADMAFSAVAGNPSQALYYQGACEVWLALADMARSLDALRVCPSGMRREIEDMALMLLNTYLGHVTDDKEDQ